MPESAKIEALRDILTAGGAGLVGLADLRGLTEGNLARFGWAVSFALPMDPEIMAGLTDGPTEPYTRLYAETNDRINALSAQAAGLIQTWGHGAWPVPASIRSDPVNIRGDFPHKTAATRAGLGWVGKHCQLVTKALGPWLRLGTVLTDLPLPAGRPKDKSRCGKCRACVEACPAGALTGSSWVAGLPREAILDAAACDAYKKKHFFHFHGGHNCGICTAACPVGKKLLAR